MKKLLFLILFAVTAAAQPALKPPADNQVRVAFVLTDSATMIDFAGPWEVFQDVMFDRDGEHVMPFRLYTVSDTKEPIQATGGMKIVPDYTFDDAPQPHVVVVPAQRGSSEKMLAWLRTQSGKADVLMSVCTGAFKLGLAGVLDGKTATTHHDFYDQFAGRFPKVKLVKSTRFVYAGGNIYTAGGLTSGIDLALHIVERYYGRNIAERTAYYMEYESTGWKQRADPPAAAR
jgi:transcriptional regulator GlxA family with amidase domain